MAEIEMTREQETVMRLLVKQHMVIETVEESIANIEGLLKIQQPDLGHDTPQYPEDADTPPSDLVDALCNSVKANTRMIRRLTASLYPIAEACRKLGTDGENL